MIHCSPPYHPSPGHENRTAHDNDSMCVYCAVFVGRVRGVYTNSWIARDQTDRFTDTQHKGFKKWSECDAWWRMQCAAHHQGQCPPFEPVDFTLNPPNNTHPSTPACTHVPPASRAGVGSAFRSTPSASTAAPAPAADDPTIRVRLMPASSPFAASPLPKREEGEPSLKREEGEQSLYLNVPPCVNVLPHEQFTPTVHTRGGGRGVVADCAALGADAAPPARSSVLMTPARPAEPAAPVYYGIRGVSVFYHTHAAAAAAARLLQIAHPQIMVSANVVKLQRWMLGEPFDGEDGRDDA
ncbi:hypothetical protein B0H14DRAFT_3515532 [Mycena olivaceomarginata]|nr:hypothetical protein B0H14DRAFT_3515532 [Mycena olivaceomarginata]